MWEGEELKALATHVSARGRRYGGAYQAAARFWSRSQFPHRIRGKKKKKALTLTATSGAASTATAREGLAEGDLVKCMSESAAGSGHRPPSLSESDSDPEPEP